MRSPDTTLEKKPASILFVCLGNICRSPTAHGVFEHQLKKADLHTSIRIDSAGTGAYHVGELPDSRMRASARQHGISLEHIRARAVHESDFEEFDLILAMDESNFSDLMAICPEHLQHKIRLFLDFSRHAELQSVPDPYFGDQDGFDHVMRLITETCENLIAYIRMLNDKI
ncbi:MAG: low molecular weight phosphotyrosine protein phosphatase [Gammaproteobacteria bacterium]|nr:low molecular weight phosphotyrosine protein phosphatase [Gammaproteobacteria bacterium]NNM13884.1 low molecular weight phosphotyrosine protein phosphatase [Gammaproteobacteria bacterium]